MDNIGDDGSYFDPDEDDGENGRHHEEDAGLPARFVPIPAGAKPHHKSDRFQGDLTRLIGAIKGQDFGNGVVPVKGFRAC